MIYAKLKAIVCAIFLFNCPPLFADEALPDFSGLSCNELYVMASTIEPQTQRIRSPLLNENTNALATAIGSVTNIGYYYFGFSTAHSYYQEYQLHKQLVVLDTLRQMMASRYCFQKS